MYMKKIMTEIHKKETMQRNFT